MKKLISSVAAFAVAASMTAITASAVDAEITWEGGAAENEGAIAFISTENLVAGTEYTLTFTINSTVDADFTGEGACVWVRWAKTNHNDAFTVDGDNGRNYVDLTSNILPAGIQGIKTGANKATVNFVYGEANDYMTEADYADASIIAISMGGGIGEYTLADISLVEAGDTSDAGDDDSADDDDFDEAVEDDDAVEDDTASDDSNTGDTTDAATTGATDKATADKQSTDTGIAGVAVIAGLAVVAAGAVVISRKK